LCAGEDSRSTIDAIKKSSKTAADEWDKGLPVGCKRSLMWQHTALETMLVEAAWAKNADKIGRIGSLLHENAEEMAASFALTIVEFPELQFSRLIMEHVASYAEIVRLGIKGAVQKGGQRMESNTLALAAFTAEWF
jgi:hypothetical protein